MSESRKAGREQPSQGTYRTRARRIVRQAAGLLTARFPWDGVSNTSGRPTGQNRSAGSASSPENGGRTMYSNKFRRRDQSNFVRFPHLLVNSSQKNGQNGPV